MENKFTEQEKEWFESNGFEFHSVAGYSKTLSRGCEMFITFTSYGENKYVINVERDSFGYYGQSVEVEFEMNSFEEMKTIISTFYLK